MEIIIILLLLVVIGLQVLLLLRKPKQPVTPNSNAVQLQKLQKEMQEQRKELVAAVQQNMQLLGQLLADNQQQTGIHQAEKMKSMEQTMATQLQQLEQRLCTIELTSGQGMEQIRQTVQTSLNRM